MTSIMNPQNQYLYQIKEWLGEQLGSQFVRHIEWLINYGRTVEKEKFTSHCQGMAAIHHMEENNHITIQQLIEQSEKEGIKEIVINRNGSIMEIPPSIGRLKHLEMLYIRDCSISDIPREIGELKELRILHLAENESICELPEELFTLPNLKMLILYDNLINRIPPEIGNLKNLEVLMLGDNSISELPDEISRLSQLRELDISKNPLKELPLRALEQMESLEYISIEETEVSVFPKGFEMVQKGILTRTQSGSLQLSNALLVGNHVDIIAFLDHLPGEIPKLLKLALIAEKSENLREATKHYETILELDADCEPAMKWLADILCSSEFYNDFSAYEKAKKLYGKLIHNGTKDASVWSGQSELLSRRYFQDYAEARRCLEKALEIEPDNDANHCNFGILLKKQFSEYALAEEHFREAIRLNPSEPYHLYALANLFSLYVPERRKESIPLYEKVLELNPQFFDALLNLGIIYSFENDSSRAEFYLKQAQACQPENPKVQVALKLINMVCNDRGTDLLSPPKTTGFCPPHGESIAECNLYVQKGEPSHQIEMTEDQGSTSRIDKELNSIIQQLCELPKGGLAVFAGAGISFNSGLPLAIPLIRYILEQLSVPEDDIELITRSKIPFEKFMELVINASCKNWGILMLFGDRNRFNQKYAFHENEPYWDKIRENVNTGLPVNKFLDKTFFEESGFKLFEVFRNGEPNLNHLLTAAMAKAGLVNTIFTTNFDTLFEEALVRENLRKNEQFFKYFHRYMTFLKEERPFMRNYLKSINYEPSHNEYTIIGDFTVLSKEEDFEPEWMQLSDGCIRVIKLHGSIDRLETIRVTLNEIANQEYSHRRAMVVDKAFLNGPHKIILIMGYSCSDIFDIVPRITAIWNSDIEILFIEHTSKEENYKLEDISADTDNNPFQKFTGKKIFYSTSEFMRRLGAAMGFSEIPDPAVTPPMENADRRVGQKLRIRSTGIYPRPHIHAYSRRPKSS